jgi:hypothetical protein
MALLLSKSDGLFTIGEVLSGAGATGSRPEPTMRLLDGGERIPFTPIGLNQPLTIEIRHVYTGIYPQKGLFGRDQSMLVTSAMKGFLQTGAAPRAVNYQTRVINQHTHLPTLPAPDLGSPLICYSPAVTEGAYSLTIEVGFQTFDQDVYNDLARVFGDAAGFPVFLPYSGYLLAASTLTRIASKLSHAVFNVGVVLADTREIDLFHPGVPTTEGGFALAIPDTPAAGQLRDDFILNSDGFLVSKADGKRYGGEVPYVVLSLDGTPRPDLEKFVPLAATADQLGRFFNIAENGSKPVDQILEGLKLYSDVAYRRKADDLLAKMKPLEKGSEDYKKLEANYIAMVANIQSPEMKPR